jgi:thioesterase domain-containing protein/acyl carrier protein
VKNVEDMYRLSPMQEGLLFHCLLSERDGLYFEQYMTDFEGELDPATLRRAWAVVINRHPALRTAFAWKALREPLQVVSRTVTVPWTVVDWTNRSSVPPKWLARLLRPDRARPFVLTRAPLLRFVLVRIATDHHVLLWSVHHLVLDGWSHALVRQEVADEYRAIRSGRTMRSALPPPFVAYVRWLERQDAAAAEQFWRRRLEGATRTRLPFSADADVTSQPDAMARVEMLMSSAASDAIQSAVRRHGLTLNTVCLAAWACVLGRHAGSDDVVFGETVSGRPADLPNADRMIGVFINTVPVRVPVPRGGAVRVWLTELQAQVAAAREFGYAPLADVQRWSGVSPGAPLFDTLITYENYPGAASDEPSAAAHQSLQVRPLATVAKTTYPVTLIVRPGARIQVVVEAHRRRVAVDAAQRLLAEFVEALERLTANLHTDIAELSLRADGDTDGATRAPDGVTTGAIDTRPTAYLAPRDATELELVRIWEQLLGSQPIGVRDTFTERGGHSILMLRLAAQVERTFDVRIALADLAQSATIERLAFAIRQRRSTPDSRLTVLQPEGDGLPLFAIVPAGGTLACYLHLASLMGNARPFYALQPRASLADASSAVTIESMAREDLEELRRVQPSGPYAIVGWSVGGLVAYEMACQLRASGEGVALLALLDTNVPDAAAPPRDAAEAAAQLVARQFSLDADDPADRQLDGDSRLERLLARAHEQGHLAHEVDLRWVRWLVDGFRIGVEAVQRYRPRPYDGRLVLLCAADNPMDAPDPTLGWSALARGGVDVHSVPGTHQSIVRPPHVHAVADRLRACVDPARATGGERDQPSLSVLAR